MIVYVITANKGTLNLRESPNGKILAQIPNGTQLDAQSEGAWSRVEYKGKIGYVKNEFLSTSKDAITKDDLKKVYDSLLQTLKTIETILK